MIAPIRIQLKKFHPFNQDDFFAMRTLYRLDSGFCFGLCAVILQRLLNFSRVLTPDETFYISQQMLLRFRNNLLMQDKAASWQRVLHRRMVIVGNNGKPNMFISYKGKEAFLFEIDNVNKPFCGLMLLRVGYSDFVPYRDPLRRYEANHVGIIVGDGQGKFCLFDPNIGLILINVVNFEFRNLAMITDKILAVFVKKFNAPHNTHFCSIHHAAMLDLVL